MARRKRILVICLIILVAVVVNLIILSRIYLSQSSIVSTVKAFVGEATGCDVELGGVDLSISGIVRLRDVRLLCSHGGEAVQLLGIKQVLLDISLLRWLGENGGIEEIEIAEPQMELTAEAVELLKHVTAGGENGRGNRRMPGKITISSGTLRIGKGLLYDGSPAATLSNLHVTVRPVSFSAMQLAVEGAGREEHLGPVTLTGKVDLSAKVLTMTVSAPQVRLTDDLVGSLPPKAVRAWKEVGLLGRIGVSVDISYCWGDAPSFRQTITAEATESTAKLKDFPLPLRVVRARVHSDGGRLVIDHGMARYKDGTIEITRGLVNKEVSNFEALIRSLPLDDGVREALPPSVRKVWDELGISGGRISGTHQFTLHKGGGRKYPQHSSDLHVSDLAARYARVPLQVTSISGYIRWQTPNRADNAFSQLELDLQGIAGGGTVKIYGRVPIAPVHRQPTDDTTYRIPGDGPDLVITGRRIEIDDDLRKAVPREVAHLFDTFAPSGTADATILLKMENRGKANNIISKSIIVDLNGIRATLDRFPYPITDLVGRIEWDGQRVKFTELRGLCGNARVTITGEVATKPSDAATHTLVVMIDQLELDERLRNAMDSTLREVWDQLSPSGRVNVFMTLAADADGKITIRKTTLALDHCKAALASFPYPVENLTGEVVIADGVAELRNVTGAARGRDTPITLNGRLNLRSSQGPPGELSLKAERLALDRVLREALGRRGESIWERFSPSGRVNATAVLEMGAGNDVRLRTLRLELLDVVAKYRGFPYVLRNIRGTVSMMGDVTQIENVVANAGGGSITLDGSLTTVQPEAEGTEAQGAAPRTTGELRLCVRDFALNQELRQALPPAWVKVWDSLQPAGIISGRLTLTLPADGPPAIGKGSSVSASDLSLKGFPLPDASFLIEMDQRLLNITDFSGTYYGGEVKGNVRIERRAVGKEKPNGGLPWHTHVELYNIDLKQVNDEQRFLKDTIRGQLTATVDLEGRGGDTFAVKGKGTATVRNGHLVNVPVIADVFMKLLNPSWHPGEPALTDADIEARVERGRVHFDYVRLSGTSVPIGGRGHIKLDGTMDMDFYTSKDEKSFVRIVPILGSCRSSVRSSTITFLAPSARTSSD